MAYTFWQQVKHSDERLVKESTNKADATTIELVNLAESDESLDAREKLQKSRMVSKLTDDGGTNKNSSGVKPAKRKIRKNLPKTDEPPPLPANQIGVNIGLPHFIVTDNLSDDETISGCGRMDGITDNDRAETESHLKKIKTLTPSAIIPDNLDKINDLCMEPSEVGGDGGLSIYKCTYCPKAFAAPYHLMLHMRKSHVCQYCLSTFSKINDLYDHVKETHKTFSCLLCSKEFKSNGNLRQHIRKNHSIHLPAHISLLNLCDLPHWHVIRCRTFK